MLKFTNTTGMNSTYYVKLNIYYLYVRSYTLTQKRASCQMAQCYYINIQCWPIISNLSWYSPEGNFAGKFQVVNHQSLKYASKNLTTKIAVSFWASMETFIQDTFSRYCGCVFRVTVSLDCVCPFISILEKWVSFLLLSSSICCMQMIWYVMGLGTCLLTPCTISLSPLACRVVWKHCAIYSVRCVSKIRSIFTCIFYIITGTGAYQLIHFCFDDFDNISNSFYYHRQIENTIY